MRCGITVGTIGGPGNSGRPLGRLLLPLLMMVLLLLTGCREELGPELFPTTTVSGLVVEGGRSVSGGWIEFVPVDGTVGDIRSARLGADGSFHADRVAIGKNALRFVNAPIHVPGGAFLFAQFATPVRREIPARPSTPLHIDLLEEAVRFQASRRTRVRSAPAQAPSAAAPSTAAAPSSGSGAAP